MKFLRIFGAAAFLAVSMAASVGHAAQSVPATIRVGQTCSCSSCNTVITVSMDTYVKHVLPNEWIASWNAESLKAGAVAVRSYGAWFVLNPISGSYDICDTTCCQVYGTATHSATDAAANATANMCLVNSAGNIVRAEYSAESNNSGTCGDCFGVNNPATACLSESVCCGATNNGHGRGMCQWGSQRWASTQAKTYDWILNHYYANYGFATETLASSDVILSGVASSNITAGGATITWATNAASDSAVEYGPTTAYGSVASNASAVTNHTINLTGLTAGMTYHFRALSANGSGTGNSADFVFATGQIIVDNPAATVAGTWTLATSAGDKFGPDYRYRGQATATSYLEFRPTITIAGNYEIYEWHSQGTNRSVGTPHVVAYNGGTVTVNVNQTINGGKWNLLGTYNLAAGTGGNVRIQANIPDAGKLAMADAIKFAPVAPAPTAPAAPSGLAASAASSSQINLTWTDNANNETNFVVARGTTSGGPYTDIATLGANATSYSNTGLSASTTYHYVVRATNAVGASANSAQASATTLAVPPAAPSGLAATAASASQVNLAWADNSSNETNFVVARSTTSGGPYTDIVTLGANVTSYSNTGLAAATTYHYVVRATNSVGASANSAQASATTFSVPPAAPSGLGASAVSTSQINLTWADNSSNETNFVVARSATSGGPYTDIATLGAGVTSYSNTGLSASTTYHYVVRATNAVGASANSAQASATTLSALPAAPSGLGASAVSTSQINLTWADNSSNETNFVVARSTTSGGPYTDIATLGAGVTSYSNTGLSASTTYHYVVRATNAAGASANSAQASATTLSAAPAAPSGLAATGVSNSQINLTWVDNSSNEANFVVARSTTSGGPYTNVATLGANVTSYSNTGLAALTTYYYVVRASNAGGASANSAQASAVTWPNEIVVDNNTANFTTSANWSTGTSAADKFGADYRFRGTAALSDQATWNLSIPQARNYEIYTWYTAGSNRSATAPFKLPDNTTVNVNQQTGGGAWKTLGTKSLAVGTASVKLSCWTTTGFVVVADAVKAVPR